MQKKNNTVSKGREAEEQASKFLISKGYQILDRNSYHDHCELDIVAFDTIANQVVFVEVKSNKTAFFGRPEYQVDRKKIRFLYRAAELWLQKSPYNRYSCRFDVVGIILKGDPLHITHYENAFVLGI